MDYIIDVENWEADWYCPGCEEFTWSSCDGVEDNGEDHFNVQCRECEYEYIVNKGVK